MLILLAASGLSAVTGVVARLFIVGAIVLVSMALDFVQEVRPENAVEALWRFRRRCGGMAQSTRCRSTVWSLETSSS
ncbi:MAG: hypothetical protein AB7H90_18265 [Alphaproteobacteria bacterium]